MSPFKLPKVVTIIAYQFILSSIAFAGFTSHEAKQEKFDPQQNKQHSSLTDSIAIDERTLPITHFGPDRNQHYVQALKSSVKIEVFNEVASKTFKAGQQLMGCTGTVISDYHILTASHCVGYKANSSIVIDWHNLPLKIIQASTGHQQKLPIRRVYNYIEREIEIGFAPAILSEESDLTIIELDKKIGIETAILPQLGQTFNPSELVIGGGGKCENDLDYKHFPFQRCEQNHQFCYSAVNIQKTTDTVYNTGKVNLTNQKPFLLCIEDSGGGAYLADREDLNNSMGAPILAGIGVRIWSQNGEVRGSTILRIDKPSVLYWVINILRHSTHPTDLSLAQKEFSLKSDEYVETLPGVLQLRGELRSKYAQSDLVCTGTAIDSHHVLLAAHCLQQTKKLDVSAWINQKITLNFLKDAIAEDRRTDPSFEATTLI